MNEVKVSVTVEIDGTKYEGVDVPVLIARRPDPPDPPTPAPSLLLDLADTSRDGHTGKYANKAMQIDWVSGTTQGGDYFATPVTSISAPSAGAITFDVTSHVALLRASNTGLFVRKTAGAAITFTSRSVANPPVLSITTSAGTFACPCVSSGWNTVSPSAPNTTALATSPLQQPLLLKFDMTAVIGTTISAELQLRVIQVFSGSAPALSVHVLDMPTLVSDPLADIGSPDTAVAEAGDFLCDVDLVDEATILANFITNDTDPVATGGADYIDSGDGFTWLRCWSTTTQERVMAFWRYCQPLVGHPTPLDNAPWKRPYTQGLSLGYDEMYFQYRIRIGENLRDAFNESGMKLSGMEGLYSSIAAGNTLPEPGDFTPPYQIGGGSDDGTWEARMWMTGKSDKHPHLYRGAIYWYGADHPLSIYSGNGLVRYFNLCHFVYRAGQDYRVEQYIKVNTILSGVPQSDGIIRVWIDSVMVHEETNVLIRKYPEVQVQSTPHLEIYHGGQGQYPFSPFYIDIGMPRVATQFIGTPETAAPIVAGQLTLTRDGFGVVTENCWNLPLDEWIEVLGTDMLSHVTPLLPVGYIDHGSEDLSGLFHDYSGSALDPVGLKQYFKGGGHQGSSNNGMPEFDFATMTWRFALEPTVLSSGDITAAQNSWNTYGVPWVNFYQAYPAPNDYHPDGKPSATHTFNAMVWRTSTQKVIFPGRNHIWHIDPATDSATIGPAYPFLTTLSAVYDDVNEKLWTFAPGGSAAGHYWHYNVYSALTDTLGTIVSMSSPHYTQELSPVIVGRKIWCFQDSSNTSENAPRCWTVDLDTAAVTNITLTGHPARTAVGAAYKTHTGFQGCAAHGTDIYYPHSLAGSGTYGSFTKINTLTNAVTIYSPTGTPGSNTNRPYGKFKCIERSGKAYLVTWNHANQNLRLVRIL